MMMLVLLVENRRGFGIPLLLTKRPAISISSPHVWLLKQVVLGMSAFLYNKNYRPSNTSRSLGVNVREIQKLGNIPNHYRVDLHSLTKGRTRAR